jgi:uncharacterized membrane protein
MGVTEIFIFIFIVVILISLLAGIFLKKKSVPGNIEPEFGKNERSTINTHTADKLMESKNLLDRGIITEEEFEEIKKDVMGK